MLRLSVRNTFSIGYLPDWSFGASCNGLRLINFLGIYRVVWRDIPVTNLFNRVAPSHIIFRDICVWSWTYETELKDRTLTSHYATVTETRKIRGYPTLGNLNIVFWKRHCRNSGPLYCSFKVQNFISIYCKVRVAVSSFT